MKLFDVAKVGLFLDTITHATEKRDGDDVKIVTLALRVQPFDHKLAGAVSDQVRNSLFNLNHPDPKPHLRRVDFALGCERQKLICYPSSDTKASRIAFDQAKISGTYARTEKNVNGYAFVFKASFGPCGREELEYIQDWHLSQRWITFEEAEPGLFPEDGEGEDDEEDTRARRPTPMFDDQGAETPAAGKESESEKPEPARQRLKSHAGGKAKRGRGGR